MGPFVASIIEEEPTVLVVVSVIVSVVLLNFRVTTVRSLLHPDLDSTVLSMPAVLTHPISQLLTVGHPRLGVRDDVPFRADGTKEISIWVEVGTPVGARGIPVKGKLIRTMAFMVVLVDKRGADARHTIKMLPSVHVHRVSGVDGTQANEEIKTIYPISILGGTHHER